MIARVVGETDKTVTIEWDRVPGAGYRFLRDGAHLSHTWDSTRTRTTFAKTAASHVFEVQALIPDVARVPWPAPPATWDAYTLTMPQANTSVHGWVKTVRGTDQQGILRFADYPDGFWLVHKVRFDQGAPGAWLDLHVTPPWGEFPYVSPIRLDYHGSKPSQSPADIKPGLILALEDEMNAGRRGHWQALTEQEIVADRSAVWTVETFVRPGRADGTPAGEVRVNLLRNNQPFRSVNTGPVNSVYAGMRTIYVWQGGYQSNGLSSTARVTTTLDRRGRTLDEAYKDKPVLGEVNKVPAVTLAGASL